MVFRTCKVQQTTLRSVLLGSEQTTAWKIQNKVGMVNLEQSRNGIQNMLRWC